MTNWKSRLYKVTKDGWSGAGFGVHGTKDGHGAFELRILRFKGYRWAIERTLHVVADCLDPADQADFYWEPITNSLNQFFLVRVVPKTGNDSRDTGPGWRLGLMVDQYTSCENVERETPRAIVVSPVTQCNLNCIHCISSHTRSRVNVLSDTNFDQVRQAVETGGVHHIATDYSGDILFANRRHGPWLRRFSDLGVPFRIDTHANDLDLDVSEQLLEADLPEINFSMDSMDPRTYAEIRRGSKPLGEVLENIESFMALKNVKRPEMRTLMSFSVMKRNVDTLLPALEFASRVGINIVQFYHVLAFDEFIAEESMQLYPREYRIFHKKAVSEAERLGVQLQIVPPVTLAGQREVHTPCFEPWNSLMILGDGSVMACCIPGSKIGDLESESLHDIWHGEALGEMRRTINTDQPPDVCRSCPLKRTVNNFKSFVPGISPDQQQKFVDRCVAANRAL